MREEKHTSGAIRLHKHPCAQDALRTLQFFEEEKKMKTFYVIFTILLATFLCCTAKAAKIAFESDRDGSHNIYLMNTDGSNQIRLTNSPGESWCPVFSPDRQKIAFSSNRSGSPRIYTMKWDGSQVQEIPNTECRGRWYNEWRDLAWSPDGQKLLFNPTYDSLATINLYGSNKTVLFTGGVDGHDVLSGIEWGTLNDIYFSALYYYWGYNQHVFHYTLSSNTWTQLTQGDPDTSQSPKFSREKQLIIYDWQNYDLPVNIFTMNPEGGNKNQITFDQGSVINRAPDWAGDTGDIVYHSTKTGTYQIWMMDSTGGNARMLGGPGNNYLPSYSPVTDIIDALVDINPDSLNKNSKGQWVTVYITLPAGFDVNKIDVKTIAITSLTGTSCQPDYHQAIDLSFAPQVGDRDEDGIADLTVKFNRQELIANLCLDDVAVTVEGKLITGEKFKGIDHIRVIDRGK